MLTQEQVKELLKNENVSRCSQKSITFSPDFKLRAVKQYYEGRHSPAMIFSEAGLDLDIFNGDKPKDCLKRWRKIYNTKGEKSLLTESRGKHGGRKPKSKIKSDKDKIRYLEAKVAYLDAENDFLAKLRGLKRE
jgi:transposase-like protein